MRKHFIFTLILTTFFCHLHGQDKEIEELINNNIKIKRQKIKGIEITKTITTNDTFITKTNLKEKKTYEFDDNGNKIRYSDYCGDSWACDGKSPISCVFFKYNKRNDLVEAYEINPDSDSVTYKREWKYLYEGGKIIEEKSCHTFVPTWFSIYYFYDNKGRLIKEKFEISDSSFQETIYYYSKKNLDSILFIHEDHSEKHIFKYDQKGNIIQKSFRFKGELMCGLVTDKEHYEYYSNGKLKSIIIYERFVTYKDTYKYTYKYKKSTVEVKRYKKSKQIESEDEFQISSIAYKHYNKYGLLETIREVDDRNKREVLTNISYSYLK